MIANRSFGDARQSSDVRRDNMQRIVSPPDDAGPCAFGDGAVREDDGLATVKLPSKVAQSFQVRALHRWVGSRVVRRRREDHLGEWFGRFAKVESQQCAVTVIDCFDARKPPTRGGDERCDVSHKR